MKKEEMVEGLREAFAMLEEWHIDSEFACCLGCGSDRKRRHGPDCEYQKWVEKYIDSLQEGGTDD